MDRDVLRSLDTWRASPHRKPLILKGARQVGKTWALREFGKAHYHNCVYLSLEEIAPGIPSEFAPLFQSTHDPRRMLQNISLAMGQPIDAKHTLLILDEIQDCPAAIGALKPLAEMAPEYHVACAGVACLRWLHGGQNIRISLRSISCSRIFLTPMSATSQSTAVAASLLSSL